MNEQNIMESNEVLEVAEEIAKTNSGLGWKIVGGVLVAAGAIYGALKLGKRIEAKREIVDGLMDDTFDEVTEKVFEEFEEKKTKKNK